MLYGELGIAKDHLYFGKYSNDSNPAAPVQVLDETCIGKEIFFTYASKSYSPSGSGEPAHYKLVTNSFAFKPAFIEELQRRLWIDATVSIYPLSPGFLYNTVRIYNIEEYVGTGYVSYNIYMASDTDYLDTAPNKNIYLHYLI